MQHQSAKEEVNRFRFFSNFVIGDECWEWISRRNVWGYGTFKLWKDGKRNSVLAHRAAWLFHKGEIPEGLLVCHHCDNPACVRPNHLFVGSNLDNCRDRDRKGRSGKKITREIAEQIRSTPGTLDRVAPLFGISRSMVSLIRRGECWA